MIINFKKRKGQDVSGQNGLAPVQVCGQNALAPRPGLWSSKNFIADIT